MLALCDAKDKDPRKVVRAKRKVVSVQNQRLQMEHNQEVENIRRLLEERYYTHSTRSPSYSTRSPSTKAPTTDPPTVSPTDEPTMHPSNLSSDANVSANSLPAQHATTKVQCPPYLSAQRSICSAQGQQPPQGVYRWRTKGLPGSSRSLRWTASVRALAARGRRTASVNGLTVRTRSMGGSTSTTNEVCASGVVPGVDF